MSRRIFVSCAYQDQARAKGFNLLRWNKNVDLEFVGRHLLDPVHSNDPDYIARKIKEQLTGTSVTVVLVGRETAKSDWVEREIQWSLGKGNGVLAIRLDDVPLPNGIIECGAEVIGWDPAAFDDAIERAALQAGRTQALQAVGTDTGSGCAR
jgi:MTH538 TIR-like domain (DUF1863)